MIGTDIVAISRIDRLLRSRHKQRFLDRFLSSREQDLAKGKVSTIAGFFAAKEAIAKALGCGIGEDLCFLDIELYKTSKNAPYFEFSPKAHSKFSYNQKALSIAHDGGFAIAVAHLGASS